MLTSKQVLARQIKKNSAFCSNPLPKNSSKGAAASNQVGAARGRTATATSTQIAAQGQNVSKMPKKQTTKKLPTGFEQTIIEVEFSLEKGEATQENISKLLSLYSVGVEHYDSVGNKRSADFFRDKIQMLFRKPSVINEYKLFHKQASNEQTNSSHLQGVLLSPSKNASSSSQLCGQAKNLHETPSPNKRDTIKVIDNLMDHFQQFKEQSESAVESDLQSQENNFKKRLEQRSKSRGPSKRLENRSRSTNIFSLKNQANMSSLFHPTTNESNITQMPINKSHLIDHSPSLSSERSLSQKEGSFHGAKTEEQELESILSSRDDFSAENILSEEWKQQDSEEVCTAISEYLASFEAHKEELLSQLGARYESQIKSLELRGMNRKQVERITSLSVALTKKLLEKVRIEWQEAKSKKEGELQLEKQTKIDQIRKDIAEYNTFEIVKKDVGSVVISIDESYISQAEKLECSQTKKAVDAISSYRKTTDISALHISNGLNSKRS